MDFSAFLATYLLSIFFGMEYGIIGGVMISLGVQLLRSLRPSVRTDYMIDRESSIEYILIAFDPNILSFSSAGYIQHCMKKLMLNNLEYTFFVIDFDRWNYCDYTLTCAFVSIYQSMKSGGKNLIFLDCSSEWIESLKKVGILESSCVSKEMLPTCLQLEYDGRDDGMKPMMLIENNRVDANIICESPAVSLLVQKDEAQEIIEC